MSRLVIEAVFQQPTVITVELIRLRIGDRYFTKLSAFTDHVQWVVEADLYRLQVSAVEISAPNSVPQLL
jgi:hypothetical protein